MCLQTPTILVAIHWTHSSMSMSVLCRGAPTRVWHFRHGFTVPDKGKEMFPFSHTPANAAHYAFGPLGCKGPLLTHVQLVHEDSQALFCEAAFQPVRPPAPYSSPGAVLCTSLYRTSCGPPQPLSPAQFSVESSPVLSCSPHNSVLLRKLAGSALCPVVQVVHDDVIKFWHP